MSRYSEYFATVSPDGKRVLQLVYAYPPHELEDDQVSLSRIEYDFLCSITANSKSGIILESVEQLLDSIQYKIGMTIKNKGSDEFDK